MSPLYQEKMGELMVAMAWAEGHRPKLPEMHRKGDMGVSDPVRVRRAQVLRMHLDGVRNVDIARALGMEKYLVRRDLYQMRIAGQL